MLRHVRRLILITPLLLVPLTAGCLTTLAVSAVAGSGDKSEHVETVKEAAKDAAERVRDAADDVALSAHDTFEAIGDTSN